ncbi:MAG: VIT domain-containing protein, partial [Planctomycetaceae bacterium]
MIRVSTELEQLAETRDEAAGFGALETPRGRLPLTALDVRGRIAGVTAHVRVRQTFRNALAEPLEATYIFPLPDRAAVTRFRLKVAGRIIEGDLKERSQARREYDEAIQAGHRAAIAEEERSGTFNLRVGNLPPGEEAEVELSLVGPLEVAGGEGTFRFPLVVAPRYTPGIPLDGESVGGGTTPDTDQVPDASRVTTPVLLPGFPNPVRLSLEVTLDPAGLDLPEDWRSRLSCSLHDVVVENRDRACTVRLQPGERLNRDFLLRFPVASAAVGTSLLCAPPADGKPGTFALSLVPLRLDETARPVPRDIVFVLDRSGSMGGWKMVAARRAVGRMIDSLLEQDRFTVLAFDNDVETPHAQMRDERGEMREASNRNRFRAVEWLGTIEARGGTEMAGPLVQAVQTLNSRCLTGTGPAAGLPPAIENDNCRERIIVLVTDGQATGEDVLLRQLQQVAGSNMPRVFTLGIDRAVNAGFLNRLADLGGGNCDLVESEDRLDEVMERVHATIAAPQLRDVRIEPLGFELISESVTPSRHPDVFPERPVTICGRYLGDGAEIRLRVHAVDANGDAWQRDLIAQPAERETLLSLWGRRRVRELEDRYASGQASDYEQLQRQIVAVSLESHVLSRFTAYVAVDRSEVVNEGGQPVQITQPVELPEGWEAESVDSCLAFFDTAAAIEPASPPL